MTGSPARSQMVLVGLAALAVVALLVLGWWLQRPDTAADHSSGSTSQSADAPSAPDATDTSATSGAPASSDDVSSSDASSRAEDAPHPRVTDGVRAPNAVMPGPDVPPSTAPDPATITPSPQQANGDHPPAQDRGCQVDQESATPHPCLMGDTGAAREVVLVGDSKALQWASALDIWAQRSGYRLRTHTKSACSFSAALQTYSKGAYTSCRTWGHHVADALRADPPEVLVVSGLRREGQAAAGGPASRAALVDGYLQHLRPVAEQGTRIVALADTPQPGFEVPECVAQHLTDPSACDFRERRGLGTPALQEVVEELDGSLVDLGDHLCPGRQCRAVLDGVLTYRKGSHVTDTWVRAVEPVLSARMDAALTR